MVFSRPALQKRSLALVTGGEFDLRESLNALYPSLFDRETRDATWVWLQANFDGIVGKMREDDAMRLFGRVPHAFCDETHRAAAEAFLAPRAKTHPGAGHEVDEALETVKTCAASFARNKTAIDAFLAKY